MTNETLVYHSTDSNSWQLIQDTQALLGMEALTKSRAGRRTASNLTSDKSASQAFIINYRGGGRWLEKDGPPGLVTLTFCLPFTILKEVGVTHIFGCLEYATTITVSALHIPNHYLSRLHAGMSRLTREKAIQLEASGEIRFYQAPLSYLVATEVIDYQDPYAQ